MLSNRARVFESWVNAQHTVLGKALKPFALVHLMWLEQIGSPFVISSKEISLTDLQLAVQICSEDTNEGILAALDQGKPGSNLESLKEEVERFFSYINDFAAVPEYESRPGGNIERIPGHLLTAASVIRETGWSDQTVWALPFGKLYWYHSAFHFLANHDTNVVSDADREAEAALDALTNKGTA